MADRKMQDKALENQAEGAVEELKGKVRGDVGDALDDHSQHAKGRVQQAKGKAQRKLGEVQEKLSTDRDRK